MATVLKLGLATASVAVIALGWRALVMQNTINQQATHIETLNAASTRTQQQAFALQNACAASAQKFLSSRGWKMELGGSYENHFNSRLNKCFVLVSEYLMGDDFRTLELYDAVEGKRYATYNGHNICEVAITRNPTKCVLDSGSIWFDGDDSRSPADFTVGFRGLLNGGGKGDEKTQKTFLDHLRSFMSQ